MPKHFQLFTVSVSASEKCHKSCLKLKSVQELFSSGRFRFIFAEFVVVSCKADFYHSKGLTFRTTNFEQTIERTLFFTANIEGFCRANRHNFQETNNSELLFFCGNDMKMSFLFTGYIQKVIFINKNVMSRAIAGSDAASHSCKVLDSLITKAEYI